MAQSPSTASHPPVTAELVRELAVFGGLPLPNKRESAVAAVLGAWLIDANALSVKMSDPANQTLVPVTVFSHPIASEGES